MVEKIKKLMSGVFGLALLILLVMLATGKLDGVIAQISYETPMLRGNDTGPTIANNTRETIKEEPISGSNNNVELKTITDTAEVVADEESVAEVAEEPASLGEMFDSVVPASLDDVDEWWHEDQYYCLFDDSTNQEIKVRVHWALEDLGEIQITLMKDGEIISDSGVCVFETDAMWSYFTYNDAECSFYFDESEYGVDTLHLFLEDGEEIELPNLKWLQENAS